MFLDIRKEQNKWFELPTPPEIFRTHDVIESKARHPRDLIEEIFSLFTETDKALYIPKDTLLPGKLAMGLREVEVKNSKDFKKLARFASIKYGRSEDPQDRIRNVFRGVSITEPHFGYGWTSKDNGVEQLKIIPLVSCVDGLELYTIYVERAHELSEKSGQPIITSKARIYLDSFTWNIPSRSREEVRFHATKLRSLSTQSYVKPFTALDFDHTCPDSIFKIGKGREIKYFCDHIRAGFRHAQALKSNTDDRILFDPFAIPAKLFVDLHDMLRYRVVVGKSDKRNVNEAEREYLSWISIPYYLASKKPFTELFRRDYEGVGDYLVKIVQ